MELDISPELAREAAESWVGRQGADTVAALGADGHTPSRDKARRRLSGSLARRGFRGEALTAALEHADRLAKARSSR